MVTEQLVLVDSSVLVALFNRDDVWHNQAIEDLDNLLNKQVLITEHVLDEVVNILLRRGQKRSIQQLWLMIDQSRINILLLTKPQAWQVAKHAVEQVLNQGKTRASYTDLHQLSLIELHILGNCRLLSYDKHQRDSS